MKLLLSGPPGSGKTTRILEDARSRLRARSEAFRLIVPTATMAEHLRNQLAREGYSFRGSLITTLAGFAKGFPNAPQPADEASISLALDDWLAPSTCPAIFREVARYPGFRSSLARTLDDLATAGCDGLRLTALQHLGAFRGAIPSAIIQAMERVEEVLHGRGEAFRSAHLANLAARLPGHPPAALDHVFFDGFFSFTPAELELVRACASIASVTVSLPAWPGAEPAINFLRAAGFRIENLHPVRPQPHEDLVAAPTREREAEEVARRILDHASRGRAWREMGLILRSEAPYASLLKTVFARFGIPARFYFRRPLSAQPCVQFFSAVIEASLAAWDHASLLEALRQPVSAASAQPDWPAREAAIRESFPGQGLRDLRRLDVDALRTPSEWALQLRGLIPLLQAPPEAPVLDVWQSRAASIRAFFSVLEQTASLLPDLPVPLARYWHAAGIALESALLPPLGAPRDAVHVLDVYEARQWELPVVFLCGLLEGEFPLHPSPDPLLPDEVRLELRAAGIPIPLSSTRAEEETFYFDLARTRATEHTILTWPRFDAKGDPTLRSFALASKPGDNDIPPPPRIRLQTSAALRPLFVPRIYTEPLQAQLAQRYALQRPTWLESFLQCPFLFFGRHTLRLRPKSEEVDKRLDPLALGSFVHDLLREWHSDPEENVEQVFDRRWPAFLRGLHVPAGWRPEFERLRLLRGLRNFAAEPYFRDGWTVHAEKEISIELEGLRLAGRIDRYDQNSEGRVQVFDFKLSSDASVQKKQKKSDEGLLLQAGLYALALQHLGLTVESAWFVPLRGSRRAGWNDPDQIGELISIARTQAEHAHREVLSGVIAPAPSDENLCVWCEFRDACRVKTAARPAIAAS